MWNPNDFCDADSGFDYVFSRLNGIFGATFANHWRDVDPALIRQEWKEQLGRYLTYRPSMDYAIEHLDGDFVPNAIKFRKLCNSGPQIPEKPIQKIERQLTQYEIAQREIRATEARAKLKELIKHMKGTP